MSKAAQGSCEPFPHALPASPLQGARPTFPSRDGSFFTMAQSRGATDSAKVYFQIEGSRRLRVKHRDQACSRYRF